MSHLPDPSALEKFVYEDYQGRHRYWVDHQDPIPRQVSEYVVDAAKWEGILPPAQITVDGILSQDQLPQFRCILCREWGRGCLGEPCSSWWKARKEVAETKILLSDTGGPMGIGVFATRGIVQDELLADYVGELLPRNHWYQGDLYGFDLPGLGRCTSREYGNWTRFVNHHCQPNVRASELMVGQRIVIVFQACEDIRPGDQLFIAYGRGYFASAGRACECDAIPGDHLPPSDGVPRRREAEEAEEAGAGDTRPSWACPEADVSAETFFLSVQRAMRRYARTPRRRATLLQTPKALRRRRVGARGLDRGAP